MIEEPALAGCLCLIFQLLSFLYLHCTSVHIHPHSNSSIFPSQCVVNDSTDCMAE